MSDPDEDLHTMFLMLEEAVSKISEQLVIAHSLIAGLKVLLATSPVRVLEGGSIAQIYGRSLPDRGLYSSHTRKDAANSLERTKKLSNVEDCCGGERNKIQIISGDVLCAGGLSKRNFPAFELSSSKTRNGKTRPIAGENNGETDLTADAPGDELVRLDEPSSLGHSDGPSRSRLQVRHPDSKSFNENVNMNSCLKKNVQITNVELPADAKTCLSLPGRSDIIQPFCSPAVEDHFPCNWNGINVNSFPIIEAAQTTGVGNVQVDANRPVRVMEDVLAPCNIGARITDGNHASRPCPIEDAENIHLAPRQVMVNLVDDTERNPTGIPPGTLGVAPPPAIVVQQTPSDSKPGERTFKEPVQVVNIDVEVQCVENTRSKSLPSANTTAKPQNSVLLSQTSIHNGLPAVKENVSKAPDGANIHRIRPKDRPINSIGIGNKDIETEDVIACGTVTMGYRRANTRKASAAEHDGECTEVSQFKRQKRDSKEEGMSTAEDNRSNDVIYMEAVRLRDGVGCEPNVVAAVRLLLISSSKGHVDSMVALADIYHSGVIAKPGNCKRYRTAAHLWWEKALSSDPNNVAALCRKGEALFHVNETSPPEMLDMAYQLFDKAASLGCQEGSFLKGKWLVVMAPSHNDVSRAELGKALVEAAVAGGLAKAYVFLGHCYEFPNNYKPTPFNVPKDKRERERLIVSLYERAAELNDPDGLNDVGSCYATGFGDIKMDFDKAVSYYMRAIDAGSVVAYDNLGTHYETGMNGLRPDRINLSKALHFYKAGAKRRCAKCALNLAIAYEDGMGDNGNVLKADLDRAEKYYKHAVSLAEDSWDLSTRARASKDLAALYITRIKLSDHDSADAEEWSNRLKWMTTESVYASSTEDVNSAILAAVQGRPRDLEQIMGEKNFRLVLQRAEHVLNVARAEKSATMSLRKAGKISASTRAALNHIFGSSWPESLLSPELRRSRRKWNM